MSSLISRALRLPLQPSLDTLAWSQQSMPTPGPGEALMRVRATSLNFHDYLVVAGHIPVAEGRVPMSDGAGDIVAIGSGVDGLAVGDRVIGAFFPDWIDGRATWANNSSIAGETVDGFAADHVIVPATSLTAIPGPWSYAEAATLPCAGLTAWRALVVEGRLESGQAVLLPGSGGLSVFALQIATALGLHTIVTSSSDEKLARLAALGANHCINYTTTPEWGGLARRLAGGEGVDLVLEIGGQSSFAQSVDACRMGGRIMVVGTTANAVPELPLRNVVMHHIHVDGMAVGSVSELRKLTAFMEHHAIRPIIDRGFPIEQLADAFRYQLTGQHLGKIVATF